MAQRICTRPACGKPHKARGLCTGHWKQEYGKRTRYAITCVVCEQQHSSTRPDGKYCSDACKAEAYRRPAHPSPRPLLSLICRICEDSFTATYRSVTCSPECERLHHLFNQRGDWIGGLTRYAIYDRDGWTCQLCMCPLRTDVAGTDPQAPSLDHIVPRSLGGSDDPSNLRAAHFGCNAARGARIT